jgi:beta-lactamase class A
MDDASIWYGPIGGPPALEQAADLPHYAASTMKVAVLAALHRSTLDLDAPVTVHNDFASAVGDGRRFVVDLEEDSDPQVWARLGDAAPLRWLAERMIVRSSNLATNLVLEQVGMLAVAEIWQLAGATGSYVTRGIDDTAARAAGMHNMVTAADLARLFSMVATDLVLMDILAAQEYGEHLAAGVPRGIRVAHKDGWDSRVRHAAGVVFPLDAPPYVLAVCTTGMADDRAAGELITRASAAAWRDRGTLRTPSRAAALSPAARRDRGTLR